VRIDYPRAGRTGLRRWLPSWKQLLAMVLLGVGLVVGGFAVAVAVTPVPPPNEVAATEATIVYYSDGATEIGRLGDATRRSVPLAEVPVDVQHAVLAAEDRDFYEHGGFSPIGIGRALWNNVSGGSTQGGSTITQQYAKNAFLTQERSWDRKLRELVLSVKLETTVSKDQILEDYLNTIYFGRGAYGIEAASLAYFGVPAADLSVEQGAVLAAIIKSPGGLSPEENPEGLEARWAYVLDSMVEQGWLDPAVRADATFPKIRKPRTTNRLGGQTGYLLEAVKAELRDKGFTDAEIEGGGLRITSTFQRGAQKAAVAAVEAQGPTSGTEGLRIGLAAVQPGTGRVIAMYGGRNFLSSQINNATRPFAQAGSTFKPYALAAAVENGIPLDSVWDGSSPQTIEGYTLTNYGDVSYGDVSLMESTEKSINTAYVNVEADVGVDAVADAAFRAGIPTDTPGIDLGALNLTFVLGTASPSGVDVAGSYATFAARGQQAPTTVLKEVRGLNGGLLYESTTTTQGAFSRDVADTVNYALQRVVTNGTGFAAEALGRPAAGKTGTTDGNRSAWFAGYTPQLATAVLMAKEDASGNPVSLSGTGGLSTVTGGSFPAAIWTAFMSAALADQPVEEFAPPPDTVPTSEPAPDCPSVLPTGPDAPPLPSGCPTPSPSESPTESPSPTTASPTEPSPTEPSPTSAEPTQPTTEPTTDQPPPTSQPPPSGEAQPGRANDAGATPTG
jgi:membrane peptidoglycan carboxypeptidase